MELPLQIVGHEVHMAVSANVTIEDASWVAEAQRGSVAAFERLYHQHVGRIYALCLRMAGNESDAQDITQETFVRAWQKLDTFRGESAFGTWLCRIAIRAVATRFRRELRRLAWDGDRNSSRAFEDARTNDRLVPASTELRIDLEDAIAALPAGARTVFVLHDVEGYRHDEIAAQLGIAAGTSKAQLYKARRFLRERIQR